MRELEPDARVRPLESEIRATRQTAREGWEVRAAQWKALELARDVFGDEAGAALAPYPPRGGFRGLLRLSVPFRGLDDHREREDRFLAAASGDLVLQAVPLVFVFDPVPAGEPDPAR